MYITLTLVMKIVRVAYLVWSDNEREHDFIATSLDTAGPVVVLLFNWRYANPIGAPGSILGRTQNEFLSSHKHTVVHRYYVGKDLTFTSPK